MVPARGHAIWRAATLAYMLLNAMARQGELQTGSTRGQRWVWVVTLVLLAASVVFFVVLPDRIAAHMNAVHPRPANSITTPANGSAGELFIADLHADTLLWNRDPARRGHYGHVDLPRLLEARMGLQVFSVVTKTPRRLNFERNDADSDNITLLAIAQRWPPRTWFNLTERALYQAQRLRNLETQAGGRFALISNRKDLMRYLDRRSRGDVVVAGLLAIEGLHALAADIANVERLYRAGFRIMGLTHFFDNAVGGSAHGVNKPGLSVFGRDVVAAMERLEILVDLAHASPRLIHDVVATATRPVVVSHTGVKGTCARTRNLSDEQLHEIAATGGLVGIAFFPEAVCGTDTDAIVAAIRYASDVIGIDHVALGSDFDGAVSTPFDVTGIAEISAAMSRAGFSTADITAVMGGNLLKLLQNNLPNG